MTHLDHPFHVDGRGRTAGTGDQDHLRDMIEQFLFTAPGERVNRPDFGSGLLLQVFEPNSAELSAALEFTVRAGLQRWLGDVVEVRSLTVSAEDGTLRVAVEYLARATGEVRQETLGPGGAR